MAIHNFSICRHSPQSYLNGWDIFPLVCNSQIPFDLFQLQFLKNIHLLQIQFLQFRHYIRKIMDIQNNQNGSKMTIQSELIEMGFNSQQIKAALLVTDDKQSAIQFIMSNTQPIVIQMSQEKLKDVQSQINNQDDFQSDDQIGYKMIFLMRMDLKLGLGKMASQIANATFAAYKKIEQKKQQDQLAQVAFYEWMESGTKKIVVKVQSEQELMSLVEKVKTKNINFYLCRSAASDQLNLPQGTITCAAIGPAQEDVLDSLTGHLKLL